MMLLCMVSSMEWNMSEKEELYKRIVTLNLAAWDAQQKGNKELFQIFEAFIEPMVKRWKEMHDEPL